MKKALSLFLALLTIASVLMAASCGEPENPGSNTTVAPSANTTAAPAEEGTSGYTVEKKDYSAKGTFTVYMRDRFQQDYASVYIMSPEDDTGDMVDSATASRNAQVEEFYNIKFNFIEATNPVTSVTKDIKDGSINYDVIYDQRGQIATVAMTGSLYSVTKIDRIDFSNSWWDKNALNQLTVKGNCFFFTNDISVARFAGARFFYFNKRLIDDYHLESPYKLLDENNWTLEKFLSLVSGVKTTTEGTVDFGEFGLVDETGSGGIASQLLYACGIKQTTVDNTGALQVAFLDQFDKIDTINTMIQTVFSDKTCVLTQSEAETRDVNGIGASAAHKYDRGRMLFADGHFLFTHTSINSSKQFIDMRDDWGVAPNPKYNSDQETYSHYTDKYYAMFCLPETDELDTTYIADVMNYWAYRSSQTVTPAFYEITVKAKRVKEEKAAEIIDLIKNTVNYEIAPMCGIDTNTVLYNSYTKGNISAQWDSYKKSIPKSLENLNKKFAGK